jgi:hypothetical protein
MKNFIALIAVSLFFASAATARNVRDMLRDEIAFCSQFVISDPESRRGARFHAGVLRL